MFEGMEIKVFPDTNINDYIKMINDEGFDAFYQDGKIIVGKQLKSDFAINLCKARRKARLSRRELADKLQLSYTSIKDFENGTKNPSKYSMGIINRFLGGEIK